MNLFWFFLNINKIKLYVNLQIASFMHIPIYPKKFI